MHTASEIILATGNLATLHDARHADQQARFHDVFPPGSYAARVPLLVHVYPTGVGTRPAR